MTKEEAYKLFAAYNYVSTHLLIRKSGISYEKAFSIVTELENDGLISPFKGEKPRELMKKK